MNKNKRKLTLSVHFIHPINRPVETLPLPAGKESIKLEKFIPEDETISPLTTAECVGERRKTTWMPKVVTSSINQWRKKNEKKAK